MLKEFILVISIMLITACSVSNNVTLVTAEDAVVKYRDEALEDSPFTNLYPGEKTYPVTCEGDCYPASPVVKCESPAEQCVFIGKQIAPVSDTGFNVRWLGHASFIVSTPDGSTVLIDPVSEQFDWPVNWAFRLSAGYNRNVPAWPTETEISNVDAVLYSHIHYDHFNKDDIDRIGNKPEYLTPLGFADHFPQDGYKISEMPWFTSVQMADLTLSAVPAHHFSSRIWVPYIYSDDDMTLWNGWVIEQNGKTLFFAGDTGYSPHFKDIQTKYGDIDVCLIPIASYFHEEHSDWYRYVHTTPEDALVAADELNCKVMIPWGYGNASWKMGDKSSHSPLLRLLHMHSELKSDIPLYILNEGEQVSL